MHAEGLARPDSIFLPALWPNPTWAEQQLYDLFIVRFGLLVRDGRDEPLPLATSEVVREGIVLTQAGASKLLHRFEARKIIWSPGEMPKLGKGNGTRLFLPGPRPQAPDPPGGWRIRMAASDDAPGAVLKAGPVTVEADNGMAGGTVDPAVELPDQPGVGDAVRRGPSAALDGMAAARGGAEGGGRSVHAIWVGHGAAAYESDLTEIPPPWALLDWALSRVAVGMRNVVGFELAQQAHDNGYSFDGIVLLLEDYAALVPEGDHPYRPQERMKTARSVVKLDRRDPWVGSWPAARP